MRVIFLCLFSLSIGATLIGSPRAFSVEIKTFPASESIKVVREIRKILVSQDQARSNHLLELDAATSASGSYFLENVMTEMLRIDGTDDLDKQDFGDLLRLVMHAAVRTRDHGLFKISQKVKDDLRQVFDRTEHSQLLRAQAIIAMNALGVWDVQDADRLLDDISEIDNLMLYMPALTRIVPQMTGEQKDLLRKRLTSRAGSRLEADLVLYDFNLSHPYDVEHLMEQLAKHYAVSPKAKGQYLLVPGETSDEALSLFSRVVIEIVQRYRDGNPLLERIVDENSDFLSRSQRKSAVDFYVNLKKGDLKLSHPLWPTTRQHEEAPERVASGGDNVVVFGAFSSRSRCEKELSDPRGRD